MGSSYSARAETLQSNYNECVARKRAMCKTSEYQEIRTAEGHHLFWTCMREMKALGRNDAHIRRKLVEIKEATSDYHIAAYDDVLAKLNDSSILCDLSFCDASVGAYESKFSDVCTKYPAMCVQMNLIQAEMETYEAQMDEIMRIDRVMRGQLKSMSSMGGNGFGPTAFGGGGGTQGFNVGVHFNL